MGCEHEFKTAKGVGYSGLRQTFYELYLYIKRRPGNWLYWSKRITKSLQFSQTIIQNISKTALSYIEK